MPESSTAAPGDGIANARRAGVVALVVVVLGTVLAPLSLRAINAFSPAAGAPPSYLPALEPARAREMAFDTDVIAHLRTMQPEFVIIGDSMAGSRVDATELTELLDYRAVAPIYYADSGSAFWYLALKNWVVGSQVRPRLVIVFFRDENLTDPIFRVSGSYRGNLDRVAREREPALNDIIAQHTAGGWYRVHDAIERLYRCDDTRAWFEPWLEALPVSLVVRPRSREALLERMNTEVFGLQAIRPMAAADMARADEAAFDFARNLPRSVLPAMFKVARMNGLKLAFVRVQRRPEGSRPPVQSAALQRYMKDLRQYLQSNGALFADDWGDPEEPLSAYADGDHLSRDARARYTELFLQRHPAFFR